MVRAFICIDFPDEVIKEIARVQEILSSKKFTGKFTELENLHLTLKFLGEIDEEVLFKVKDALKKIKFEEFELILGKLGVFNYKGNPKIIWAKVNGASIWELQKKIDESLKELFKPEERFMSHLTVARMKYVPDKAGFHKYVLNTCVKNIKFKVDEFYLKSSELKPLGPVYDILDRYKSVNNSN